MHFLHPQGKTPYFYIARKLDDLSYLERQFKYFITFCNLKELKKYNIFDKRTGETYHQCKFVTRASEVFNHYYKQWYRDVKILPENLTLTPLICAIWFCDDGSICSTENRLKFKLATHCFTEEENYRLAGILKTLLREHFGVGHDNGNCFITAADAGAKAFIRYTEGKIAELLPRKVTWTKEQLNAPKSYAQIKNRNILDFNNKEVSILILLLKTPNGLSPKSIAKEIGWTTNSGRHPSGLSLYLNRFIKYNWLEKYGTPNSYKNPMTYRITDTGREICKLANLT